MILDVYLATSIIFLVKIVLYTLVYSACNTAVHIYDNESRLQQRMSQTHVYTHYNVYLVSNLPNRPQPSPAPTLPYHVLKRKRKNIELHSFLNHQFFMIEMESFFRDLFILPINCMSVDIFTVGGHSDAFGDVTVIDEEASSSVSSSLALSP